MSAWTASLRKESLLVIRDWHALALLFLMPCLFIVIMSLALQERFGREAGLQLAGQLHYQSLSADAGRLLDELHRSAQLKLERSDLPLSANDHLFSLSFTPAFDRALAGESDEPGLELRFAPELGTRERLLIRAAVQEAFAVFSTQALALELGYDKNYAEQELLRRWFIAETEAEAGPAQPNAVQQNVPAWLIFAMFFIAVPLSTTVIDERRQRTLARIRTFGAPVWLIYSAKLLPYIVINLLQLLLMLALGAWLLPLAGAEGLSLAVHLPALAAVGLCTSLCALALASVIAAAAKTVAQATAISGSVNILLAAIGGVMIPLFIMPPLMQKIAQLSPMAWALEGFLSVLVRGGGWAQIAHPCLQLLALTLVLGVIAMALIQRGKAHA
ncbi:ABC transporter permease [Gilvimarinus algae]|uniref:ABC transporter permease n=1 Tax=Gilvimarinus algae TaxID=3058037 RepID=A0ABT8TJB3_9GAMM|nr:ABC transporter permease [Gilvimarinus sp. SDUM040014]MDO3383453.1 ABC transporter permease [Gilvimarinus sp. SDUM040014]